MSTPLEVFFDDFSVYHGKSLIRELTDYYPFGLTFNAYHRENSMDQRCKFQGQEHIADLDLGWDSFKWRNHQPELGRFFNIDPLAEKYKYNSLYAFSENKVVAHVELEGLESVGIDGMDVIMAMYPKPEPIGGEKILGGIGNVVFGTVRAIASGTFLVGTEGVGAALGGRLAFSMSLSEIPIGIVQIVNGVSEVAGGPYGSNRYS